MSRPHWEISSQSHGDSNFTLIIRDRHTPFKSLDLRDGKRHTKAISLVHERVENVLASWRDEQEQAGQQKQAGDTQAHDDSDPLSTTESREEKDRAQVRQRIGRVERK